MTTYTYSQITTFNMCRYKWQLNYLRNVQRKEVHDRLDLGSAVHAGLAQYFRGGADASRLLVEEGIVQWGNTILPDWLSLVREFGGDAVVAEAQSRLEDNPNDPLFAFADKQALAIWGIYSKARYLAHYALDRILLQYEIYEHEGESLIERRWEVAINAGVDVIAGTTDVILRERSTGRLWLVDFKVRQVLQEAPERDFDIQMALYQQILRYNGINTIGSIIFQIRSELPRQPELLKSGKGMSRTDIITTWDVYRQALIDNGFDPLDYLDMAEKLQRKEFFKEIRTFRPPETLDTVWMHIMDTIDDIKRYIETGRLETARVRGRFATRNINGFGCPNCPMLVWCRHEGGFERYDATFITDRFEESELHK